MDTTQRHSGPRRLAALLALAAALAGCSRDMELPGAGTAEEREPASLVVTAELPRLSVAVRGTRADGEGGTGFDDIDKTEISRLTLFLIDWTGNRLVGYRNIYPNPDDPNYKDDRDGQNGFVDENGDVDPTLKVGTKVRLTFPHNGTPKHGASEILTRGNYTILAVANYRAATKVGMDTEAKIDAVIELFEQNREQGIEGIPNFKDNEICKAMYNLVLKMPRNRADETGGASDDQPYLRPSKVPMPVSCAIDLPLIAGMNKASLKLTRVCARVQIEVKNYSSETLTISDLKLSDNFTQSGCFLIPRRQTWRNYKEWNVEDPWDGKGAPDVTHERAITPFEKGMTIPGNSADTIFDGLIYESCDSTRNYTYTLDLGYNDANYSHFDLKDGKAINSSNDVGAGYYLIRRQGNSSNFVFVTDETPSNLRVTNTGNLSAESLVKDGMKRYFWELVRSGNGYLFRSVMTEDYIKFPSGNNGTLTVVSSQNDATTITVGQSGTGSNRGLTFRGNNRYASVSGTSTSLTATNSTNTRFWLYELEKKEGASLKKEITLTTIDPVTAEVFPVHEIRRNDFIHILVEVSYNPTTGDFDFEVSSWKEVENGIEYN